MWHDIISAIRDVLVAAVLGYFKLRLDSLKREHEEHKQQLEREQREREYGSRHAKEGEKSLHSRVDTESNGGTLGGDVHRVHKSGSSVGDE